jgi:ATP-binding cassette subfamily F protein 2
MAGELLPTLGDIRPHGHLKLGRFTQHFVDILDLNLTPLEFFEKMYPGEPRDELRKYLGRFGVSGKMQMQKMEELSDGQCSRVVFAKLGKDAPHILLLDEPTNHLDMESIDALAKAVNEFSGGMVLVSHDMRLISQVAKEIWICDHKTITKYKGDIQNFKMDMRSQMGIEGDMKGQLRGDASVVKKPSDAGAEAKKKDVAPVSKPAIIPAPEAKEFKSRADAWDDMTPVEDSLPKASYVPPHLRNKDVADGGSAAPSGTRYIPPHLRNKD